MPKAPLPRDKNLRSRAAELRNNATKEEKRLWYDFLHAYPIRFNRQRIIGDYIADFYCSKAKLVVELDGAQHYEEAAMEYDEARTRFLESLELRVLRFSNYEVDTNFDGVCAAIDMEVRARTL